VKLMSDSRPNAVATVIRAFCVLAFLSLAFCVLALLSFTAGTVPPQAGPVMDALPADRDYVASITASISGYEAMTDIEKVRALRQYVYQHTPFENPLIHDQVVDLPLSDAYAVFAKGVGGVYCGGAAIMLSRIYKAAGFDSWLYDFGDIESDSPTTHQTTLVKVDGDVVLQDAYFNFEYVDSRGMPISFLDLITLIHAGVPPAAKEGVADKDWPFEEADLWAGPQKACHSTTTGIRCIATITFSRFLELEPNMLDFLEKVGEPRRFEYLLLHPISLVSLYPDGAARAETLLGGIKQKTGAKSLPDSR
jgi:hypothetical protein